MFIIPAQLAPPPLAGSIPPLVVGCSGVCQPEQRVLNNMRHTEANRRTVLVYGKRVGPNRLVLADIAVPDNEGLCT